MLGFLLQYPVENFGWKRAEGLGEGEGLQSILFFCQNNEHHATNFASVILTSRVLKGVSVLISLYLFYFPSDLHIKKIKTALAF